MLNEKLEFEAYVTDPESDTPRIQRYLLIDKFSRRKFIRTGNDSDSHCQRIPVCEGRK